MIEREVMMGVGFADAPSGMFGPAAALSKGRGEASVDAEKRAIWIYAKSRASTDVASVRPGR